MKGADAEGRALAHLTGLGHVLLARNYRVRGGELDLVTRQGAVIVFTEVKQRRSTTHGHALEMLSARQASRLRRTAMSFLLRTFGRDDVPCRFDFIAIEGTARAGTLTHLENVLL